MTSNDGFDLQYSISTDLAKIETPLRESKTEPVSQPTLVASQKTVPKIKIVQPVAIVESLSLLDSLDEILNSSVIRVKYILGTAEIVICIPFRITSLANGTFEGGVALDAETVFRVGGHCSLFGYRDCIRITETDLRLNPNKKNFIDFLRHHVKHVKK